LGVIRVIWASAVCNLDQSRDWLWLIWTKLSFSVNFEQSVAGSSAAWCKKSVTLSLFVFEFALGRGAAC